MNLEKTINEIVEDLQTNAMPFETYVYEVKSTHQIIRKHLIELLKPKEWDCSERIHQTDFNGKCLHCGKQVLKKNSEQN